MTYQDTLTYLFNKLPMYQRHGAAAYKKDLGNIRALCEALGQPQTGFPSIHVAGTNGKGSVSHMLASILQSEGYKVGLHTSPHYKDFRERIKLNGQLASEQWVTSFVDRHRSLIEDVQPSFFEVTTAMAFSYFADNEVDIAIVEVGLGGRLDSTNILVPVLSIITNIGYDHQQFLGDTLPAIAREKAGIIKKGVPVIIGQEQEETTPVFEEVAAERNAPLTYASRHYHYQLRNADPGQFTFDVVKDREQRFKGLTTDCASHYQLANAMTALQAIAKLPSGFSLEDRAIRTGLRSVRHNTGLIGRWQILAEAPLTIADGAHNTEGLREVSRQLQLLDYETLHIVYGCVSDKEIDKLLPLLPREARYYFCEPAIDRKMPIIELERVAASNHLVYESCESATKALEAAKSEADQNDLIFVGGSIFVVAEIV